MKTRGPDGGLFKNLEPEPLEKQTREVLRIPTWTEAFDLEGARDDPGAGRAAVHHPGVPFSEAHASGGSEKFDHAWLGPSVYRIFWSCILPRE